MRLPIHIGLRLASRSPTPEDWHQWGDMGAGLTGFIWGVYCLSIPHPESHAWWGLGTLVGIMSLYQYLAQERAVSNRKDHSQVDQQPYVRATQDRKIPGFWQGPLFWCAMSLLSVLAIW